MIPLIRYNSNKLLKVKIMIYNPNAQESERKGRNIFKTLAD
jgi:hypothetical protein